MQREASLKRVRVLIADDEPIMRDVARLACEDQGVEVLGEVTSGLDAVEETIRLRPDVLVLDLDLRDIDGFEVSRRLRAAGCDTRVLGTTGEGGPSAVFRALRFGIAGLMDKLGVGTGLRRALASLDTGGGAFTPEQQEAALDQFESFLRRSRERGRLRAVLTPRERDVTALIAAGLTTRQMASRLGVSEGTIESHITRAYRKLGVRTRVQAAARAVEVGLADLDPRSRARRSEPSTAIAG
jgi:DNA-binding NarL/FixJ family response regulator